MIGVIGEVGEVEDGIICISPDPSGNKSTNREEGDL